jgi:hypothetical protein
VRGEGRDRGQLQCSVGFDFDFQRLHGIKLAGNPHLPRSNLRWPDVLESNSTVASLTSGIRTCPYGGPCERFLPPPIANRKSKIANP